MKSTLLFAGLLCGLGVWLVQNLEKSDQFGPAPDAALAKAAPSGISGRKHQIPRHRDGHFYVHSSVEGRPVVFMVDSGASHVMLTSQDAERLGRYVKKRDLVHQFHTANGVNYAARITLAQLRIGGRDFQKIDAFVFPKGLGVSLLGQSVLSRFAAVEMRQDQMELRW